MAYNPTKTRTWKDGVTPATGTLALGSLFDAEYNQLYENDNFLKAYFATDNRLTVDEIESDDGDGVNFLDVFGYNVDAPVSQIHLNESTSNSCLIHFTNSTTGAAIGDGFSVGLDASENAVLYNKENSNMLFYTNNQERMRIDSSGNLGIGANSPQSFVHIQNNAVSGAAYNAQAILVLEGLFGSGNVNLQFITGNTKATSILFSDEDDNDVGYIQYDHNSNFLRFIVNTGERLRIDSAGRVLINTSSGTANLEIEGSESDTIGNSQILKFISEDSANHMFAFRLGDSTELNLDGNWAGSPTRILTIDRTSSGGNLEINGTLTVSATTESTTKDTGALIVEGGVGVEKNVWAGGTIKNTDTTESSSKDTGSIVTEGGIGAEKNIQAGGYFKSVKGRWPSGNVHGDNVNDNTIFDAMSPSIPNTNDEMIVSGSIVNNDVILIASRAIRLNSITINLYVARYNVTTGAEDSYIFEIDDGATTEISDGVSLAW
jgi:hypothetical protein